jgi:hypothetical protein
MGIEDNNDSTRHDKVHKRAKAWDGFLGSEAEFVSNAGHPSSSRASNVRFDGASEKAGGSDGQQTKDRIASCREAYENVGIIGNIVDLMVDFAIEGIDIYHKSNPIQKFFRQWAAKVNLDQLSEQILKSVYRDGNVPILSYWGEISDKEVKSFKKSVGRSHSNLFTDEELEEAKIIPYRYQVLDVLSVSRTGSNMLGTAGWEFQFDASDYEALSAQMDANTRKIVNQLRDSLGTEAYDKLKSSGRMTLDPARFDMIYYKKDGYKSWANPMLWRVMDDVKFKKLIRDMDISVAEGVTNALTVVKLGATKEGLPPSKKKYQKIVSMLKNPSKAKTIVWDDLIDIQTVFPPVEKFFSADKYKQVDDDIRSGLGIAEILINGGGGNYSSSFLSVKTLLERLEMGRKMLLTFLEKQVKIVSKNMGFRTAPVIRMSHMSLNDQESEKKFLLELFDRNAISFETLTERFGENFDIELERVKGEDKKRDKIKDDSPFGLLRVGKFGPQYPAGPPELVEISEGADPSEENTRNLPSAQEQNGKDGGRKTGDPQKRKDDVTPKAPVGQSNSSPIAFTEGQVSSAYDALYSALAGSVCKDKKYSSIRSLKESDKERITSEVISSIAHVVISSDERSADLSDTSLAYDFQNQVINLINKELYTLAAKGGKRPGKRKIKEIVKGAFSEYELNIAEIKSGDGSVL